jgi:cephalosporin hydroxylase
MGQYLAFEKRPTKWYVSKWAKFKTWLEEKNKKNYKGILCCQRERDLFNYERLISHVDRVKK